MSDVKGSSGREDRASAAGVRPPSVDADTLKAFAHPLRMRMYGWLKDHGAGTASMLAVAMGESTGQTSYHLRQLAKHGLVVEDPTRGTGRERWWEATGFSFGLDPVDPDPTVVTALELVMRTQVEDRREHQLEWIDRQRHEERDWLAAVTFNETTTRLTPQELRDLNEAVAVVVAEHTDRAKQRRAIDGTDGTRMVKVYAQHFPLPPD